MLSTKHNRSVNICGVRTQWDFWELWMGRSATHPDHACSLWGTSPADAEEGVETACGKGGSLPPSPHFHPRCSALIYEYSALLFWTWKPDEKSRITVQNMAWDWFWAPSYPFRFHVPWSRLVVVYQCGSTAAPLCCLSVTSGCALGGVTWVSTVYKYVTWVRNAGAAHSLVTGGGLQEKWEQATKGNPV